MQQEEKRKIGQRGKDKKKRPAKKPSYERSLTHMYVSKEVGQILDDAVGRGYTKAEIVDILLRQAITSIDQGDGTYRHLLTVGGQLCGEIVNDLPRPRPGTTYTKLTGQK